MTTDLNSTAPRHPRLFHACTVLLGLFVAADLIVIAVRPREPSQFWFPLHTTVAYLEGQLSLLEFANPRNSQERALTWLPGGVPSEEQILLRGLRACESIQRAEVLEVLPEELVAANSWGGERALTLLIGVTSLLSCWVSASRGGAGRRGGPSLGGPRCLPASWVVPLPATG